MNKIFKVIWSKARNCYVVVSELAKSHDDGHVRRRRSGCCRKAAVLAAFVLTTSLSAVPVWAADGNGVWAADSNGNIVIGGGKANAAGSIVIGNSEAIADTSQSVIIGNYAKANGSGQGIIVIGNGAMADSNAAGYTDNGTYIPAGIVLGEYSYSNTRAGKEGFLSDRKGDKPSTAFTDDYWNAVWKATANPMAIGNADTDASGKGQGQNGHGVLTRQITGVAAGTDLTDAVNVAQLKAAVAQFSGGGSGTGGSGVHDYSVKSVKPDTDTNYNNKGATGDNALAAGVSASATGAHSVAVGNGAQAVGQDSIALGTNAKADGIGATAIGQYNTASGQNSLAFGGGYNKDQKGNTASGVASVAFGEGTQAIAEGTLAFGENTQAGSTEKDNQGNLLGQNAVAFGNGTKATGGRSLAFGEKSTAAGDNSLAALGGQVTTSATNAAAIGKNAQAILADSVALGSNSVTTRAKYSDLTDEEKKAVYIKGDSTGSAWEATDNAIAVGNDSEITRQITGVAAGSLDTDAVNVAQLKKMAAEGLDFQGNNDVTVHRDLGQKLTIQGEGTKADTNYSGENLKVIGNTDGSLTIKMDKDIKGNSVNVGEKGEPGTPGKDGSIGLKGKDGANGLTIRGDKGKSGVDGTDGMTRIVYEDNNKITHEVATLDDGLKFGGDFGTTSAVKLDKQVNVKGNAKNEIDLTDGNIGVVSSQDGDNGQLLVKLNKDLNLGNNGSVKMGNTTINNDGVTIQPSRWSERIG